MRFTIQHVSGARAGQTQVLEAKIVRLGRDPSCEVAFDPHSDDAVSANHCQLLAMDDGRVQVVDQGSSNGTFLNGQPVGQVPVPVLSGAVLRLGEEGPKVSILFELTAAGPSQAAPAAASGGGGSGRLLVCLFAFFLLLAVGAGGAALLYFLLEKDDASASAEGGEPDASPADPEAPSADPEASPPEPEPEPEPEVANDEADLSHVKVGQVYVYEMQGGMKLEWSVTAVATNKVTYSMTTLMDMGQGLQPVGDPTEAEWEYLKPAETTGEASDEPQPELSRESVTVSDVEFDCLVVESEAAGTKSKTWASMTPGSETVGTFPGVIKSYAGDDPSLLLVEIRPPE